MSRPSRHFMRIRRLKDYLGKVAFASLIADICISATTVISLWIGQKYTIGILFVFNYILTIIVATSLLLMAYIAVLSNSQGIDRILRMFRFR